MKDLRNYITHRTTPPLQFQMHFTQGAGTTFSAQMHVEELRSWNNWSAASRLYLEERTQLVVIEPIREYKALRDGYYTWLFEQFDILHGDDIREHDAMVTEQRQLLRESGLPI